MALNPTRKTYPQLTAQSLPVQDGDILAGYRSPGPLKRFTVSNLRDFFSNTFASLAALAAGTGSDLIGIQRTQTGSVLRTVEEREFEILYAADFGVVQTGVTPTDQSANLQKAIDAATSSTYTKIVLPAGPIWLNSPVNCTNKFGGGISFVGANGTTIPNTLNGTVFILNTGGVAFDCTGSQNVSFENVSLDAVLGGGLVPNPSTIGILQARSTTSQYAQFNRIKNVFIRMSDDMSMNGGNGSYAIVNIAAEIASYEDIWLIANNPFGMWGQKPAWVSSPFVTIDNSIISLSVIDFAGTTTMTGYTATQPLMLAELAKGVSISNFHAAGVYSVCMDMDGCDGITVNSGRVEGASQIIAKLNNSTNIYLTLDTTGGTPTSALTMGANFNANRNIHLRTNMRSSWNYVVDSANVGSILRQLVLNLTDDDGSKPTTNFPGTTSVSRLIDIGGYQDLDLKNPNVTGSISFGGVPTYGAKGASIADVSGGSTVDAEARTAINAILARMRAGTPSINT